MAATKKERVPPTDLPKGTTLLDLTDDDVGERACFVMSLLDYMREELEEFIVLPSAQLELRCREGLDISRTRSRGSVGGTMTRALPEGRDSRATASLRAA
jgi:hypothetical protein